MANSEVVMYGASMKNGMAGTYTQRGPHFARAVARAYLWEIAGVVSQVESKEVAAQLLFDATDAILAGIPVHELGPGMMPAPPAPAVPARSERLWQYQPFWRAMMWAGVGFCWHWPIVGMLHWAFGW